MQPADSSDAARLEGEWARVGFLEITTATLAGRRHEQNEDSALCERLPDGTWLLAVADGIGGYEGGEVASALTVATLREVMAKHRGDLEEGLRAAFDTANERILQMQKVRGTVLHGMGTTLTALGLANGVPGSGVCAHIGDSRLYRFRGDRLTQLSRDHNVGAELVDHGVVPPQDLPHHPQRHMLTRALGAENLAVPDVFAVPYLAEDVFLLVTDGLVEAVGEAIMAETLLNVSEFREVGPRLIDVCERTVAADDATVVAVRVSTRAGVALEGEGSPR